LCEETRRIEITDANLEEEYVSVDFEFGSVLVNFNFKKIDLSRLKQLIVDLEAYFKDMDEINKGVS
jgi:hypothetical protein